MSNKTLLSLPNNVLNEVAKRLDYKEILHLREVCKALNGFVNINQPDFNMKYIQITAITNGIVCKFGVDVTDFDRRRYMKSVVLCDMDPYKWNTLNTILGHQKSTLEIFDLVCSIQENGEDYVKVLEHLKGNLSTRKSKIQVKSFRMNATSQHQVMQILPFINPKKLEKIALSSLEYGIHNANPSLDFDEIRELEQWKKTEKFHSKNMLKDSKIDDFIHFEKVKIMVDVISISNLVELKEIFLRSPPNRNFRVRCNRIDVDVPIETLGQSKELPRFHPGIEKYYNFPIPNNEDYILVLYTDKQFVHIYHLSKEEQLARQRRQMENNQRLMEMHQVGPMRHGRIWRPNIRPIIRLIIPRREPIPRRVVVPIEVIILD